MTLRSVRVLATRLRKQEDDALVSVREVLRQLAERVEVIGPGSSPQVRDTPELMETLVSSFEEIRRLSVLLLRSTMGENMKAMGRDVLAVEASLGPAMDGLGQMVFDRFDSPGTLVYAEEQLETSLVASWRVMIEQMDRQKMLADRYAVPEVLDLTDAERELMVADEVVARWVSPTPLRLMGRKGVGVIPSFASVVHAAQVNWVYALVNGCRDAIAQELQKEIDRVVVAV